MTTGANTLAALPPLTFDEPPAVVVGVCGHGLSVIYALRDAGVSVIALEADGDLPGARTSAALVVMIPDINGEELIPSLVELRCRITCPGNPVLFLTNDTMVQTIGKAWERLAPLYLLSWSGCRDRLLPLLDKTNLAARCASAGLNYPRTFLINNEGDVADTAEQLGFPMFVKPSRPLGQFKTALPSDTRELAALVSRYRADLPFLAQQFIPGDDRTIFFSALYLSQGEVLARFDGRKLRSRPLGHTTIAESCIDHEVFTQTVAFFAGSDISGPVSLELKRDVRGHLWVIEPTAGRTDFWVGLCIANDIDIPTLEYRHQLSAPLPRKTQTNTHLWFNEERDPFGLLWFWSQSDLRFSGRRPRFLYRYAADRPAAVIALRKILSGLLTAVSRRIGRAGSP